MKGRKSHAILDAGAHRGVLPQPPGRGGRGGRHRRRRRHHRSRCPTRSSGRSSTSTSRRSASYATGIAFLPGRRRSTAPCDAVEKVLLDEGFSVLGWRDVPVDADGAGQVGARGDAGVPADVRREAERSRGDELERHVYVARKRIEHTRPQAACTSRRSAARVVVYKGMLTPDQLQRVLPRPAGRARRDRARARALALLAPTRSRAGRSRTRTGCSRTTARSTPCRATRTGCAPAKA